MFYYILLQVVTTILASIFLGVIVAYHAYAIAAGVFTFWILSALLRIEVEVKRGQ